MGKLRPRERIGFNELRALTAAQWQEVLAAEPAEAARWLDAAARYGLVEAQVMLGQILLDGRGVPRDPARAYTWFVSAGQAGHVPAMNMMGRCLERGWGVAVDYSLAAAWYRKAAEQSLDWAQYNLANMLLRGRCVLIDRPAAFAWFLRAARQGHAKSMNLIARFLEEGWDVPIDHETAFAWYRAAAQAGDYRAQYNLATLALRQGRIETAAEWFQRAVQTATPDVLEVMVRQLGEHAEPTLRRIGALAKANFAPSPGFPPAGR